jgi:DNA-binding MarR family transcriptional regulator
MSRVRGCQPRDIRPARTWEDRAVVAADDRDQARRDTRAPDDEPDARSRAELICAAAMEGRLHQNSYDRFEDAAAAYFGVNRTAMRCMEVLERKGQLTAGEIATQTGLSSGAVTAMLDRLTRDGLVQRLPDPTDRRRVLVQLTDKARQIAADVYGPLAEEVSAFERYTDDELRFIERFMRLASEALDRHADRVERQTRPARRPRVPPG